MNPTLTQANGDEGRFRAPEETAEVDVGRPFIVQSGQTGGNGSYVRPADEPLPVVMTKNDISLVNPHIVLNSGERKGQEPRHHNLLDPLPTVTSKSAGSLVSPALARTTMQQAAAGIDPRRLVLVDGQPYLLDIRFRMLENAELARAMGFEDEETTYEFVGNVSEVTKQIGNAVPVNLAAALVGAILADGRDETQEEIRPMTQDHERFCGLDGQEHAEY